MSVKYVILGTEGPDDQAILCSFLKAMGFKSVNDSEEDVRMSFWKKLLPDRPKPGSYHAYKNLLYPYIFNLDNYSIAVYQGQGSNLAQNLYDKIFNHSPYKQDIHALGIVIDADTQQPANATKRYVDKLRGFFPAIPEDPGVVVAGPPHLGMYVWPDGQNGGTLETLLLDCASFIYPDHKAGAEHFLNGLDTAHKAHWRGSDPDKALVASIVSVLQPGKANHASFAKPGDKWVSEVTLEKVAGMKKFWLFLHELLDPVSQQDIRTPISE